MIPNSQLLKQVNKPSRKKYWRLRAISFLNKRYYCSFDIRKDSCSICGRDDPHTEIHHFFYLPIMMWSCTQELCDSCHNDISQKTMTRPVCGRGNKVERLKIPHIKKGRPMKHRPLKTNRV